jgi:hypothetical protein
VTGHTDDHRKSVTIKSESPVTASESTVTMGRNPQFAAVQMLADRDQRDLVLVKEGHDLRKVRTLREIESSLYTTTTSIFQAARAAIRRRTPGRSSTAPETSASL